MAKTRVSEAMQEWLLSQEDQDMVITADCTGKNYTAKDMIREIENETAEGIELEKQIIQLTIDLLFRKVERI